MKIIAFTGAGISKQSNIPTFMERPDIRDRLHRSFAQRHPEEYNQTIAELKAGMANAEPNPAHYALAQYNIPVITMNIDGLHTKAGSKKVLELHGGLPEDNEMDHASTLHNKPVLYGDPAPNYERAFDWVSNLDANDIFIVVGCSYHTAIANDLRHIAQRMGCRIYEIQEDAAHQLPALLERLIAENPDLTK
ncbi:transcriptional regulator [Psittacicella melopsittaci]|uniref:protein acetyllysine N-acetyltransferase n=1 Tax=Psittacicella melopsittaci TaxID=2028576 RepID=A0A3A1Y8L8_9GAMM|nr:Sir2 family NAD-dependent protein deacetylase [Psittacicella melopsittaci]RIY33570.1 transcriptional regulator [Psittacicella melopsittaci]